MCGIAGIWTRKGLSDRLLGAMTDALTHRGPDDRGTWSDADAGIGFAHTRLAIVDLSPAGHQPMPARSGRYWLAYNGEIYNHADLRAELDVSGHGGAWRGHSDTETLLAAIERWGLAGALKRSIGMFALALWDAETRTLSLARDRMGEKPLYYGWASGNFLFGSELKALRTAPGFDPPIDRLALDALLRTLAVPAPKSIFEGVFKLMPGMILTLSEQARDTVPSGFTGFPGSTGGATITPYWSIDQAAALPRLDFADPNEASLALEQLLVRSIRRQLLADVPVGTFLSGGYDSSTVAALQQAIGGSRVETFSIGFAEAGYNEAPHARAVAEHFGTRHHELQVGSADALAVIPELPTIYDEPFADSSQIPTILLSRMARQRVTVALSGDGGDELFGGYNRHRAFARAGGLLRALPGPMRGKIAGGIEAIGAERLDKFVRSVPQSGQKARRLAQMLRAGGDLERLYPVLVAQWPPSSRPVLGVESPFALPRSLNQVQSPLDRMMAWDMADYLPNDVLHKVDRASMSASLETRAPLLDHEVVEFALRLPSRFKLRSDGGKAVLRDVLYRYVPRTLVDRPKTGFAIPLGIWLRGPLREWAETLLTPDRLDHFDASQITAAWHRHLSGKQDESGALWPVLMFQAWEIRAHQPAMSPGR